MRRPEGIYGYSQVIALGGFLRRHDELSEPTRSAMAKRLPLVTATGRALAPDEFEEVRAAARKMFRSAHLRIRSNTEHLRRWREGSFEQQSRDWLIGEALDSLARTGYVPYTLRESGTKRTIHSYVAVLGGEAPQYTWMRLFLTRSEAYALAVLLVIEFGLNATVVSEMRAPRALQDGGPDGFPIYRLELEKRRRGAGRHFETPECPGHRRRHARAADLEGSRGDFPRAWLCHRS